MEKAIGEIKSYLQSLISFSLPSFRDLPGVDLYMEQVLQYVNGALESLSFDEGRLLTSFMVNNYVKAKMIGEPVKKRYSKEQIGYLMAICLCKSTLSMSDMSLLLELDDGRLASKERIYDFWSDLEKDVLTSSSEKALGRLEQIGADYEKEAGQNPQSAEEEAQHSLALLAFRLSIQAQADKLLSDAILSSLRKQMHGEEVAKAATAPGPRETKHEKRQGIHEAERVAGIKARIAKNERKK